MMALDAVATRMVSIRLACSAFSISETCYRYQSQNSDENTQIAKLLVNLTVEQSDWGFGQCFNYLRNTKGHSWNHKRVYRIYCELALNLRIHPKRVIRVLDQLLEWRKKPIALRCDNGPEFISHEFVKWAKKKGIRIDYIQPGNPQQNAYIERYNRTARYGWVSKHLLDTLEEVQDYATEWLWFYNYERPHTANGGKPPLMAA
jgi:putative transposase